MRVHAAPTQLRSLKRVGPEVHVAPMVEELPQVITTLWSHVPQLERAVAKLPQMWRKVAATPPGGLKYVRQCICTCNSHLVSRQEGMKGQDAVAKPFFSQHCLRPGFFRAGGYSP